MEKGGRSHPDCINSSNPYHECVEYCFKRIAEAKAREEEVALESKKDVEKEPKERMVHPSCINAANPYHECSEFCYRKIADSRELVEKDVSDTQQSTGALEPSYDSDQSGGRNVNHEEGVAELGNPKLTDKWDKMAKLKQKLLEAKKANQMAMVEEKKKMEAPAESRGISKQKWLDERKKKIGKLLDSNGLDMQKAYMLDTQEMAETKYKKWEKEPAPHGWDVFNQKTLYNAYKKRTKNIEVDMEAYNKAKEDDSEFYRGASSLQYGKVSKVPEENIDRMVKELQDREAKKKSFSRRRKFHEEKDIDAINDRNEHFNKKIERAFGKYTLEIKNNLERGTALPD